MVSAPEDTVREKNAPLTVSLITCYPGPEVYALCGHTALRVRSEQMDSVWNYGLFDFTRPDFVYRFVKGETDYNLGGYPFAWFLPEYVERGSKVVEQDLNLTQPEARRLLAMLRTESLPQNRTYRYNYVRDNCSTRVVTRLDTAASSRIVYPDSVRYGSYRREMRAYHGNYPWYQFGIDLVLGSGLDGALDARQEMFVPVEFMREAAGAHLQDGRRLVKATRVLNQGMPDATLPPTPWWLTPLFWGWIMFGIAVATALNDVLRRRTTAVVYSLYWLCIGVGGIVVWFLTLCSEHEAVRPNILKWWLEPLMLIGAVTVWMPQARVVTVGVAWLGLLPSVMLLMAWPFQPQSGNPAIFPLLGAGALLGAAYAINYAKLSYKDKGPQYGTKRPERASKGKTKPASRKKK